MFLLKEKKINYGGTSYEIHNTEHFPLHIETEDDLDLDEIAKGIEKNAGACSAEYYRSIMEIKRREPQIVKLTESIVEIKEAIFIQGNGFILGWEAL